jgi:hypothetical protein
VTTTEDLYRAKGEGARSLLEAFLQSGVLVEENVVSPKSPNAIWIRGQAGAPLVDVTAVLQDDAMPPPAEPVTKENLEVHARWKADLAFLEAQRDNQTQTACVAAAIRAYLQEVREPTSLALKTE